MEVADSDHTTGENNESVQESTNMSLTVYSQDCATSSQKTETTRKIWTLFNNSVVRVACYDPALINASRPCSYRSRIEHALRFFNATISISLLRSPRQAFSAFRRGNADVMWDVVAASPHTPFILSVTPAVLYSYETFYSSRGKVELVSLLNLVTEFKQSFYHVLAVLVSSMTVLGVANFVESRYSSISATLDSLMVLLASLFATSSPLPNTRRWVLSRRLVYGIWILVILPPSNYIKSELTSRLSFRPPPQSLDTLDKLEDALDAGAVSLCVVGGTATARDLRVNFTGNVLYAKLHSLYRTKGTKLETNGYGSCLTCARQEGHICLINRAPRWVVDMVAPEIVESVEPLRTVLGTTPVRKNYPLAKAYGDLLRRTFETSLRIHNKQERIKELWYGTIEMSSARSKHSEKIDEFRLIFSCFLNILGVATAVLAIEILVGRCLHNNKVRNNFSRS
ncbi:hypothetical protein V5799_006985 [Amblyomma americanum]|uniref:Uncharacterized protein n=1 Tax=Amblyomma americanum TaxID=6943 RepID=A0AAQ4DUU7_AMBAM